MLRGYSGAAADEMIARTNDSLKISEDASGSSSIVKNWIGEDRSTGIQSSWIIGPIQQALGSNDRPSRIYNPKLIRSNGSGPSDSATAGPEAPSITRRGGLRQMISSRGRLTR